MKVDGKTSGTHTGRRLYLSFLRQIVSLGEHLAMPYTHCYIFLLYLVLQYFAYSVHPINTN